MNIWVDYCSTLNFKICKLTMLYGLAGLRFQHPDLLIIEISSRSSSSLFDYFRIIELLLIISSVKISYTAVNSSYVR